FSSQGADITLIADVEKAVEGEPKSAVLCNALGVALGRQSQGKAAAPYAAEVAAEYFRRAAECQPTFALRRLILAEALDIAGQNLAAIDAARRALEVLQSNPDLDPACLEGPYFGNAFETFGVAWERAAWTHAADPEAERQAKHALLRWRLYTL